MLMLVAATPIAEFIGRNPTVVMLALAFLLVIGMALIADGWDACAQGLHLRRDGLLGARRDAEPPLPPGAAAEEGRARRGAANRDRSRAQDRGARRQASRRSPRADQGQCSVWR